MGTLPGFDAPDSSPVSRRRDHVLRGSGNPGLTELGGRLAVLTGTSRPGY
ncbi:hypothetical protein [Amycolatopsis sp. NBC_00438]